LAVWPFGRQDGMRLYAAALGFESAISNSEAEASQAKNASSSDITSQTALLYDRQNFDNASSELQLCLRLKNNGDLPIRTPLKLEAVEVRSAVGTASVTNATNRLPGVGAVWDISDSVAGDRIPAAGKSDPFCLAFHINAISDTVSPPRDAVVLLILRLKTWSSVKPSDLSAPPKQR